MLPADVGRVRLGRGLDDPLHLLRRVVDPGISGAIRIPVGMPLRLSSATASSRARGFGVCGSVARQAFSSSVGTDRQALTSVTAAISFSRSRSRSTSGDFVRIEHGFAEVAHRLPDPAHQLVAALDPLVRVGVRAERDRLPAPRRPRRAPPAAPRAR